MTTSPVKHPLYASVPLAKPASTSFRLLQIKGDYNNDYSDQVECTLSEHCLSNPPSYRCLSYAWGVRTDNSCIKVNATFSIEVRKNLRLFLERIRKQSSDPTGLATGYFWIDAICIDQEDTSEKKAQLDIMGAIYSEARQVVAWLGWEWDRLGDASDNGVNEWAELKYPEIRDSSYKIRHTGRADAAVQDEEQEGADDTAHTFNEAPSDKTEDPTEAAIDFIRVLVPAFRAWTKREGTAWSANLSKHAFDALEMYEMLSIPPIRTKTWAALAHFLNRQWFHRTWIVQEAALAKEVKLVCGRQVLSWDEILQTCIFLQASGWFHRLLKFTDADGAAEGAGWRGIVLASMQDICRLEPVSSELGHVLPSPLQGLDLSFCPIDDLDFKLLLFYMTTSRPFEAGDKRDKVFAPLALLKQVRKRYASKTELQYEADYEDSKTPRQVYIDASALILQSTKNLLLLSQVEVRTSHSIKGLPSWVPDFSQRTHNPFPGIPGLVFSALPGTIHRFRPTTDAETIQLEGIPFAQITSFGPDFEDLFRSKDWRPWIIYCLTDGSTYENINGETYAESLWRSLIANFDGVTQPAPSTTAAGFKCYIQVSTVMYLYGDIINLDLQPYTDWHLWTCFDELREMDPRCRNAIPSVKELQDFAEHWRSVFVGDRGGQVGSPMGTTPTRKQRLKIAYSRLPELKTAAGPSDQYSLSIGRLYYKRRFFRSKKGMGLAPESALKGDKIWFLSGGSVPFLLRQVSDGTFRLVGECYVHDFMNGEIWNELSRPGGPAFQSITLC